MLDFLDIIRHTINNFVPTKNPCTPVQYRTATMVKIPLRLAGMHLLSRSGAPPLPNPGSAPD